MVRSKRLLAALLVVLTLLPFAALAENVTYDVAGDTLTVSYTGCQAGGYYSLFLLKPGASLSGFGVSDVLFVDQLTADAGGRIEALFVSPALPAFTAVLGGTFASGSSPRSIGSWEGATDRKTLNLPARLSEIQASAFEGGTFTHVYLGESVTSIGSRAFANCASLVYIYIPDTAATIADDAFAGSSGVVIGCHEGSPAARYAQSHGIDIVIVG